MRDSGKAVTLSHLTLCLPCRSKTDFPAVCTAAQIKVMVFARHFVNRWFTGQPEVESSDAPEVESSDAPEVESSDAPRGDCLQKIKTPALFSRYKDTVVPFNLSPDSRVREGGSEKSQFS